jgi:hypothetical protein
LIWKRYIASFCVLGNIHACCDGYRPDRKPWGRRLNKFLFGRERINETIDAGLHLWPD